MGNDFRDDTFRPRIMDDEFGYESVLRSHNKFIKTRSDVLVIWFHWMLLRNVFKGRGGEGSVSTFLTEHLPRGLGWNGDKRSYLLKYELGNSNFGLGVWVRGNVADASITTLDKSMKIGVPILDVVGADNNLRIQFVDDFTRTVETQFVLPMMPEAVFDDDVPDNEEPANAGNGVDLEQLEAVQKGKKKGDGS